MKCFAIIVSITVLGGTAWSQQSIIVGPNVQTSAQHSDWEHNEVVLATDPQDARHLLAGSMFLDPGKGDYSVVTYVSFDGGKSWTSTLVIGREGGHFGDPAVAFGCDGTAYSVLLKSAGPRPRWQTLLYRSGDGGKNWLRPTILPYMDREYITVDCASEKYRGRVYIHGNRVMRSMDGERISGASIFISEDNGENFLEAILTPTAGHRTGYQGNGVVLSDGTYIAPFTDLEMHGSQASLLQIIRSEDGGNGFLTATTVARRTAPPRAQMGPSSFGVDQSRGPFRDRIYAVWTDGRSGRSEILLAYSADKGMTWSEPTVVNDDRAFSDGRKGPDNFMGTVAVNREGVVGVTWYDRRDSPNNQDWWVRFAASFDGGNSFTPSVKLSDAPFSHNGIKARALEFNSFGGGDYESPRKTLYIVVGPSRSYFKGGDTAGLAAADGVFFALWIDNRSGVPQVWTAPITVNRPAIGEDTREFQNLDDTTQKLVFEFGDQEYDSKSSTLSVKVCLVNTSDETLKGPIIVRVLRITPDEAEILNSDNDQRGKGAVWEYSSLLKDNKLGPGERTGAKLIQLHVLEKRGNQPTREGLPSVFPSLSVQVFSKLAVKSIRKMK